MGEVKVVNDVVDFDRYERALDILERKAQEIKNQLDNSMGDNPIIHYKGRVKKKNSIKYKLEHDGLEFNDDNIMNCLNDVVGFRFVCCVKNDLRSIINLIKNDPDIIFDRDKDFITSPKDSGYLSYHMIVRVPVVCHVNNTIDYVKAEIQVRTLAMDLWAAVQHVVCYKKDNKLSLDSVSKISDAAKIASQIDCELEEIIKRMELGYYGARVDDFYDINSVDVIDQELISKKYRRATDDVFDIISNIEEDYDDIYIEHKKSRVKTPESICRKLSLNGRSVNNYNIDNCLSDVAGVRIVCRFRCDIDNIINRIRENPKFKVIGEKDYITYLKDNGYSGYHMIVEVPVCIEDKIEKVKVEIQIRTLAMDLWDSLEEKICYKKIVSDELKLLLKNYSEKIYMIDRWFDDIVNEFNQKKEDIKVRKLIKND